MPNKIFPGMSEINKNNPLIIIMRNRDDEVSSRLLSAIKLLIITYSSLLILGIITQVVFKALSPHFFVYFLLSLIILIYLMQKCTSNTYSQDIYNMLYSKEFSTVYVNDEKIMAIIETMDQLIGKIDILRNIILSNALTLMIVLIVDVIINSI